MSLPETRFDQMSIQLIQLIRGKMPQATLSRELKISFNIVNRWETGRRHVYWDELLLICKIREIQIGEILGLLTGYSFSPYPVANEVFSLLTQEKDRQKIEALFSKGQIHRLKSGSSKFKVADLFALLELTPGRGQRLLELHFGKGLNPESKALAQIEKDFFHLADLDIIYTLVSMALNLKSYQNLKAHSDEVLANLLQVPVETIKRVIQNLNSVGFIELHENLYRNRIDLRNLNLLSREGSQKIIQGLRNKLAAAQDCQLAVKKVKNNFFIYATSVSLDLQVFDLVNNFSAQLRSLIDCDRTREERDSLAILSVDLFYPVQSKKL